MQLEKKIKTSCIAASIFLLIVGIFHGSGINYVNNLVQQSNVSSLVKNIFPILFLLPSVQLIGLGVIGILTVRRKPNYAILLTLSIWVLVNSIFAFWLKAIIPGIILLVPSLIFMIAAWTQKKYPEAII